MEIWTWDKISSDILFLRLKFYGKKQLGIVAHTCDPSTWEAETEELLQVWGHPGLHNEFLTSLDCHLSKNNDIYEMKKERMLNRKEITWVTYPNLFPHLLLQPVTYQRGASDSSVTGKRQEDKAPVVAISRDWHVGKPPPWENPPWFPAYTQASTARGWDCRKRWAEWDSWVVKRQAL